MNSPSVDITLDRSSGLRDGRVLDDTAAAVLELVGYIKPVLDSRNVQARVHLRLFGSSVELELQEDSGRIKDANNTSLSKCNLLRRR